MRKLLLLSAVLTALTVYSCKDDLDPFGETNEKYVLNCVVRADTNYQTLTLTRSYATGGFDPYAYTQDPAVKGALVRLWEGNDKVSFFTDTTITRIGETQYQTPYTFYHARGINPEAGTKVEIEAILPNGKKLTASGTTPTRPVFRKINQGGEGDTLIPPPGKDYFRAVWGTQIATKGTIYLPRIYIVYKVLENGEEVRKIKLVPKGYFMYRGVEYPEYPGLSYYPWISIDMKVVDRCMAELSEGDADKSKYKIYSMVVDVVSLDNNLSAYYNATNKNKDPFAVKLYETDYTNINGGFGVFGISFLAGTTIDISAPYVRTFRYEHAYKKD